MRMVLSSPGAPQRQAVSQLHEDLKTGGQDTRLHFVFYPYFCGVSGGGMGKLMGALSYSW